MNQEKTNKTNAGVGGEKIPAPHASLMAVVAKGIFERRTEWILIPAGMFMGLAFAEIEFLQVFDQPSYWLGLIGLLAIGAFLVIRAIGAGGRRESQ
ncbi:MAG: hypothetical protein WBC70_16840 [Candidatus Aminicenantales bacterium]